jgi:hypothetical protein
VPDAQGVRRKLLNTSFISISLAFYK